MDNLEYNPKGSYERVDVNVGFKVAAVIELVSFEI